MASSGLEHVEQSDVTKIVLSRITSIPWERTIDRHFGKAFL